MLKPYKNFSFYGLTIPAILVGLDQATKFWAIKSFGVATNVCEDPSHPAIGSFRDFGPVFDLALVCNRGISFGLMGGDSSLKRWGLTIFALVMCVVLLYALSRTKDNLSRLGISLIIGGAIGNAIDRFLYGAVTDFISVRELTFGFFPWVFNVADSAITIGVILLIIASWMIKPEANTVEN